MIVQFGRYPPPDLSHDRQSVGIVTRQYDRYCPTIENRTVVIEYWERTTDLGLSSVDCDAEGWVVQSKLALYCIDQGWLSLVPGLVYFIGSHGRLGVVFEAAPAMAAVRPAFVFCSSGSFPKTDSQSSLLM